MSDIELKPCPFCGCVNVSKFDTDFRDADGPMYTCVKCKDCGSEVYDLDEDKAIDKWNRRREVSDEIQRPLCCAECVRYFRDNEEPGCGYCDEWAGILLHDGDVCHPNIGRKQKKEGGAE